MQQKNDWIKSRRNLLKQIKRQVHSYVGGDHGTKGYGDAYKKEFRGQWAPASMENLVIDVCQSDCVLGGDFHAFPQAQRTHLRILRSLPKNKAVILALECVESKYQKKLDDYLSGRITEKNFLKAIEWDKHWGFSWSAYKPLLEFAIKKKWQVVAINKYYKRKDLATMQKRDLHASQLLVKLHDKFKDKLLYTIIGDLHLARGHLPLNIDKLSLKKMKLTRVFLNSEKLYFRLAKDNLENKVEVLSSKANKYCVVSSPPWVKWQSYLMFLEEAYDEGVLDDASIDYTDQIASLAKVICKDLKIKINMSDLAVYSAADEGVWHQFNKNLNLRNRKVLNHLILSERSFYSPTDSALFLSRPSINHCASLAGYYVHAKFSNLRIDIWKMPENFLQLIWFEALGFFLSKLINHKRKAERMGAIKNQLRAMHPKSKGREALSVVVNQRLNEMLIVYGSHPKRKRTLPKNETAFIDASRYLGSMMGERIYEAYLGQRLNQESLTQLIAFDMSNPDFAEFYYLIVKRLEAQVALIERSDAIK